MNTYTDLQAAGLSARDAAAQIAQETAMRPGKFGRARHVLATRIVEAYDGPYDLEGMVAVDMFGGMLAGIETAEAAGITAEEAEAAALDLIALAAGEG